MNIPGDRYPEADLGAQIKAGDELAFAAFYDRFAPVLFSICKMITGEEKQAAEVLEAAFVHMWKGRASYDPQRNSLSTWAVMIARHLAMVRQGAAMPDLPGDAAIPGNEPASRYALGLLDRKEAAAFERRLESDPQLREVVDQLDEKIAARALASSPVTPPPDLRARVLRRITKPKVPGLAGRASWIGWGFAVILGLSCGYLVSERNALRKRVAHLEQRDVLSQVQIASLISKLPGAPRATGIAVWDGRKQRGVLKVSNLPPNLGEQAYRLWISDSRRHARVSAGSFRVSKSESFTVGFQAAQPIKQAEEFAVTLQDGSVVLLGK